MQMMMEQGIKFLVFAHHVEVMDGLQACVEKAGVRFMRIDGKTSLKAREAGVHGFQNDPNMKVAILSIQAACSGITLTAASNVVFAEICWNPSNLMQAEDRVHRIGQTRGVHIHYLLAKDSGDDFMWCVVPLLLLYSSLLYSSP